MAKNYTVVWGDTLTKIAKNHGFDDWRVIYNHPSNAAFKAKRPNPDKIFVGDIIVIPDLPGSSPATPPSPPPPRRGRNAFFVTADVAAGQTPGAVLSTFGLDAAGQIDALRDPHNAHLQGNSPVPAATTVVVPIDIQLSVLEFRPVIDITDGLIPKKVGEPPTATHGVRIRIGRNLLAGTSLNWIQTVIKRNNPDPKAPLEFVDIGINNLPFFVFDGVPAGAAAPREFFDNPSAPIAPAPGRGVDFTATTTVAVLVRGHIILAAGKVWRYVVTTAKTLPDGVQTTPARDATDADFRNQLRILRVGQNQLRQPTGANLDYVLRPAAGTVIT